MIITTVRGNKVAIDPHRVVNVQESWHEERRCVCISMDTNTAYQVFDTVEYLDAEIQKAKGIIPDNPENDCTPYQHPAYSRGEKWAMTVICREINNILDGKDIGGVATDQNFQALKERLAKLVAAPPAPAFTPSEIQALKHMVLMNTPPAGART